MRVLVTGASGFVGSHCLPALRQLGFDVFALSLRRDLGDGGGVHWLHADLLNPLEVVEVVERVRPTHLLHLAWCTHPGEYWNTLENVAWLRGSLALLESFARQGGQRAVFIGSCAEYDWRYGFCSEFLTPLAPATLYGACKHALQIASSALAKRAGLSFAWARLFFLYGPGEQRGRLVPSVIESLLAREPALCSSGKQIRDFLFVVDAAEALVALLASMASGPVNIASGAPVAVGDLVGKIADRLDARDLVRRGAIPLPDSDPPLLVADVGRITKEVGWRPRYDLEAGLDATLARWRNTGSSSIH